MDKTKDSVMTDGMAAVRELAEPVVKAQGCELWGVQWIPGRGQPLLRIMIERDSGIEVDDCEAVSRQLSAVLDVENTIAYSYTLEVSSPGLDRPLLVRAHYLVSTGQQIDIRLKVPFEQKRRYQGLLQRVEGDDVVLVCDGHEYFFPLEAIEKARVVPRF